MRTTSLLKVASLALVLTAPLASIAKADHAGDQWRSDDDSRQVATTYYEANPALVQLEQRVYMADTARTAQRTASFTPIDGGPTTYVKPNPGLAQMEQRVYENDTARTATRTATFTPSDGGPTTYVKSNPALQQLEQRTYEADTARGTEKNASVTHPGAAANN